ncbi:MAG: hypothetical protein R3C52_09415 [Hyphomonadaceae bacterium]
MRRSFLISAGLIVCGACAAAPALPQQAPSVARLSIPTYEAIAPLHLTASKVREYTAPEARQGVAVDATHFYAVVNNVIAKYDKLTGERIAYWFSPRGGLIRHINSCIENAGKLWCANSNFPETPMASSVEVIDTADMTHSESRSLGILDEGSLTFFESYKDGWLAGFAHYDGEGGLTYKDGRFAGVVTYDAQWRRTGGWMLPNSVLERMAPHAASGGALGPDGYLYMLGHDRPEMYVLARPTMGPKLIHIATIDIDVAGQAFSWDRSAPRTVYAINRPTGTVRVFTIPDVATSDADAHPF